MIKNVILYTFFKWYKKESLHVSKNNHNISRRGIFSSKKVVSTEWLLVSTLYVTVCEFTVHVYLLFFQFLRCGGEIYPVH
jgi:hypothetical protein